MMKTKLKSMTGTRTLKLGAMGLAILATSLMAGFSQITWQSPTVISTTATLDAIPGESAGATLVQSVGFGIGSVQTVSTVGAQNIPFSVGVFNSSYDTEVSGSGTMLGYSGSQTLTAPSTGSTAFNAVLAGDGWAEGNGPTLP